MKMRAIFFYHNSRMFDALMRNGSITSVEEFMSLYNMNCPLAQDRLLNSGVAATVLHATTNNDQNDKALVHKATENFITLLDSLEIGTDSVSGIVQILTELCIALNKLSTNFEGKNKMHEWLQRLSTTMHASDSLGERDIAQLKSDAEQCYNRFSGSL